MFAFIIVAAVVALIVAGMAAIVLFDAHKANADFRNYRDNVDHVSAELLFITENGKTHNDEMRRLRLERELNYLMSVPAYGEL